MEQNSFEEEECDVDDPRDSADPRDNPAAASFDRRSIASSISNITSVFSYEKTAEIVA